MSSTYKFQLIKSSWGIAVDLTASLVTKESYSLSTISVGGKLHIGLEAVNWNFSAYEKHQFVSALRDLSHTLLRETVKNEDLVVSIERVEISLCDYQEEGLYFALIGWATQYFNLPMPRVDAVFDKDTNKYYFRHLNFYETTV